MKFLKYILLIIVVINFNSCSNSTEPTSGEIKPLAVGNYWDYQFTVHRLSDNELIQSSKGALSITGTKVINNNTCYINDNFEVQINKSDGLWNMSDSSSALIIPYPTKVGNRIFIGGYNSSTNVFENKYLVTQSTNTQVSVPAGSFSCYAFKTETIIDDKLVCECEELDYYSPGVGLVKQTKRLKNSRITLELIKFGKR